MRVAIDVSIQDTEAPTGVERAQATLVTALLATEGDHRLLLASPTRVPAVWRGSGRAEIAEGPRWPVWLWRETGLVRHAAAFGAAVVHSPVAAVPLRPGPPSVATLHELPWAVPEAGTGADRSPVHRLRVRLAARRAARLVCPSRRTADQLLALHPETASRIRVIPHGVDPVFVRAGDVAPPAAPLVLAVGRLRRKKNLDTLLEAFTVWRRTSATGRAARLVLAGPDGDAAAGLRARAARPDLAGAVDFAGFVPDGELAALYARASCLVLPSHLEGFGLPALEAMASGTPVLASRRASMDEAATLTFDAADTAALAAALEAVVGDERLRASLVARGRACAARLDAASRARAVLELWSELL